MNGFFDIKLIDVNGMSDVEVVNYVSKFGADALCKNFKLKQYYACRNRIFHMVPALLLKHMFGLGDLGNNWDQQITEHSSHVAGMCFINLSSHTSDTTSYTETYHQAKNTSIHSVESSVNTSNGSKYFMSNVIEDYRLYADIDSDRIVFKDKFLYVPSQSNSGSIRNISIYFRGVYATLGWTWNKRIGRARIKDEDGNLTQIVKNDGEALLFEYTFTLVSI